MRSNYVKTNLKDVKEYGKRLFANPKYKKSLFFLTDKERKLCEADSIPLAKNVSISLDSCFTKRNLNTIIFADSKAGQYESVVLPTIKRANASYVILDPGGRCFEDTAPRLMEQGYRVRRLNTADFSKSDGYNPLLYATCEADVIELTEILYERLLERDVSVHAKYVHLCLLRSAVFFLLEYCNEENEKNADGSQNSRWTGHKTLQNVREFLAKDEECKDSLFDTLRKENAGSFAARYYDFFKDACSAKIRRQLTIELSIILDPIGCTKDVTSKDEVNLSSLTQEKTAIFVEPHMADTSYDFLIGMLFTQAAGIVMKSEPEERRKGPHVRLIMQDPERIGYIPNLNVFVAIDRMFNASICALYKSLPEAKACLTDHSKCSDKFLFDSVDANCDIFIFLGSRESATVEYAKNEWNRRMQKKRNRISMQDIAEMPAEKELLFARGLPPVCVDKIREKYKKNCRCSDYTKNTPWFYSKK